MSALSAVQVVLLTLQMVLSLGIFATCFCRLAKTDVNTIDAVVLTFWAKGMSALLLAGAPFLPLILPMDCQWPVGTTPDGLYLPFMLASLSVQITTAVHWRHGVPTVFVKGDST